MEKEEAHGIVIVGGGVCGIATALALHRKGIASLVLEKSDALRDGVAFGVHANGWRALEQLGVAAELRETANVITAYYHVWQQQQLPIREELRCLKRKNLIETMAKNLPSGAFRYGCHVVAIHQDPSTHESILTVADGCTIRAKVVIGCDGGNSMVAKYLGLSVPKPNPLTVLRGFTTYQHKHPFGTEFQQLRGRGEFFVGIMPINHNLVHFHVVNLTIPQTGPGRITKDVISTRVSMLEMLQAQDCPSDIIEMVRNSDSERLHVMNNIWYRPPWQVTFSTFHKGAVTVAGDAMHAMGPFIGQGTGSALEDAVVLARLLSRAAGGDCTAAIQKYVRERRPRLALLSLETFAIGTLQRANSLVLKLVCILVLALLGSRSCRHASYNCGRL